MRGPTVLVASPHILVSAEELSSSCIDSYYAPQVMMSASVMTLFRDEPEYKKRMQTPFKPTTVSLNILFHLLQSDSEHDTCYIIGAALCCSETFVPEEHRQGDAICIPWMFAASSLFTSLDGSLTLAPVWTIIY
jgi:hypothetical protein